MVNLFRVVASLNESFYYKFKLISTNEFSNCANKSLKLETSIMSVRIHLKELIYLTLATLIILIFVWHLTSDTNSITVPSKHKYAGVTINPEIYKIKRVHFSSKIRI